MALPDHVQTYIDALRTEVRNASPSVEGTFRHNKVADVQNAVGMLEDTPAVRAAVADINRAMAAFQSRLDGMMFAMPGQLDGDRATAYAAIDAFAAALEGAPPSQTARLLGIA
ncbi:MAG TPA: hypothetical protein VEA79_00200 [Phenylobacterium sp.]|nr:hypothetical protein [Phenylobacterium sp.]